jgi:hypothetical protein
VWSTGSPNSSRLPSARFPSSSGVAENRRILPAVVRHADIWHSFEPLDEFRRKNTLVKQLAERAGRDEAKIQRAMGWSDAAISDAFVAEGVTLFTTEIHPTSDGYDFSELKAMIAWRDK